MSRWRPIDGETPIDPSGLKIPGITNRRELSIVEAANVAKAVYKYLAAPITRRRARFDLAWALKLHREMFGDVWKWAGRARREDLNVGVPWHRVEADLMQLFDDLAYWETAWPDRVEQAAQLHYRAVCVHPFQNGNGRWARMLANVWLHVGRDLLIDWPADVGQTSPIRDEYLAALREADAGEFGRLLELHRRFQRRS